MSLLSVFFLASQVHAWILQEPSSNKKMVLSPHQGDKHWGRPGLAGTRVGTASG